MNNKYFQREKRKYDFQNAILQIFIFCIARKNMVAPQFRKSLARRDKS